MVTQEKLKKILEDAIDSVVDGDTETSHTAFMAVKVKSAEQLQQQQQRQQRRKEQVEANLPGSERKPPAKLEVVDVLASQAPRVRDRGVLAQ